MKSCSTSTAARRYAARQEILWTLELSMAGEPWRAASREIILGGQTYPARLAAVPQWRMESAGDFGPGGVLATAAEVRVNDLADGADSLRERLQASEPLGIVALLKLLWTDEAGGATAEDAVTLLRGVVVQWKNDAAGIVLTLRDRVTAAWERRVGRVLLASMVKDSSPLVGHVLPLVIGHHEDLPLLALIPGIAGRLRTPLAPADAVIGLASIAGFPPSGVVQVGGELIQYSAVDAAQMTLGTAEHPIVRSEETMLHSEGEPVRSVPGGGFTWLVADHPCAAVEEVRADGVLLDAGNWTAQLRALGGFEAQVVSMDRWPFRLRFEMTARSRTAEVVLSSDPYAIAAETTARTPVLAIDAKRTSTAARLAAGSGLLAFQISTQLASEGRLLGRWNGASLRVRYSATRRWGAGSQLLLRFKQGTENYQAVIPRPNPEEGQGEVEAPPGEQGAGVQTSIGVHEFELDLAPAIAAEVGWEAFAADPPAQMQVEFIPDADDAEILIHDLELLVRYFARLAAEDAKELTARVSGWRDAAGAVIENPADVLKLLLTGTRFGALADSEIDAASLADARSLLAAKGFSNARRIEGGPALSELIETAAREAALWLRVGGERVTFAPAGVAPTGLGSVERLDETKALDRASAIRLLSPAGFLTSNCLSIVASPAAGLATRPVWNRCASQGDEAAEIPARRELRWLDGRSAMALAHVGERVWASLREALLIHKQSYPPGALLLEPGDAVIAEQAALGLVDAPCWVESLRIGTRGRAELALRGPWAGEACWQADAQTMLRVFGFGDRMIVFLGGVPVASIDRFGNLAIIGRLREAASFSAGPFTDSIAYSGGLIYWSTGASGAFTPFLRIDAQGFIELNGTLREASNLNFVLGEECHGADAERFSVSARPFTAGLEYRAADARLHLAGRLTEQAEL